MNKYKLFGVMGGIAVFLTVFGAWAKITHQSYAGKVITIGMWMLAVCGAIYVYLKFTNFEK